jgi:hypothetical protein
MTHREGEVVHAVSGPARDGAAIAVRQVLTPFGDIGVEFGDGDRAVVPQVGLAV